MVGNFKCQMVLIGNTIMIRSRINPGSACAWKNCWISKHRPPAMVLSQKKARGMHWKQAASVKAIDVAAVRPNKVQAVVRMAPFQLKMRRYRHMILSFGRATEIKYTISKAKRHFAQPTRADGSDCSRNITCRPTPPTLVKTVYDKG